MSPAELTDVAARAAFALSPATGTSPHISMHVSEDVLREVAARLSERIVAVGEPYLYSWMKAPQQTLKVEVILHGVTVSYLSSMSVPDALVAEVSP